MSDKLLTSEFRVSFPHLFKAVTPKGSDKAKFSISMLFPKRETLTGQKLVEYDAFMTAAKKAAGDVAKEKWGEKAATLKLKTPFLDAGEYEYEGYEKGMVLIRASSVSAPQVVDAKVVKIIDDSEIYPGCYGKASVNVFAYDSNGNRGVSFGLGNFQKTRDGDNLGGRSRAEDDFVPLDPGEAPDGAGPATADSIFG